MGKKLKAFGLLIACPIITGLLVKWLASVDIFGTLEKISSVSTMFLGTVISLPLWALVLIVFAVPLVCLLVIFLLQFSKDNELSTNMQFLLYNRDSFYNVDWTWDYSMNAIDDYSIVARCPKCMCVLDWVQKSSYRIIDDVTLVCPICHFEQIFNQNKQEIIRLVHQCIDQKIVTGEFRENPNK